MVLILTLPILLLASAVVNAAPQKPSVDPFYQPPADFANTAAGTVLRQRTIVPGNLGLLTPSVKATQLLYRTQSLNGSAIATVTTVFQPLNHQSGRFISYQIPEDSAYSDCAPSYGLQAGSDNSNSNVGSSGNDLQMYLVNGYIVATPDYEGPDSAFPSRLEGYITLDGMRAVDSFLGGSQDIVGAGYSGGAIATGWAASLQSSYASQLNIKGWIIGGTPANLTGTFLYQDGTAFSGFAAIGLAGLNTPSAYKSTLDGELQKILTDYGKSVVNYAATHCVGDALINFAFKSILSTDFNTLGAGILNDPPVEYVLGQLTMGLNANEKPIAPVFLYHGQSDEVIPYADASTLYLNWCAQGANIQFNTYLIGGHITLENIVQSTAISYAGNFFTQNPITGCGSATIA